MDIKIQAVHFDVSQRLESHIEKKLERMSRHFDPSARAEVTLKVVKPETNNNKEVALKVVIGGQGEHFASKCADTFEEAFDSAAEAIERQIEKIKRQ